MKKVFFVNFPQIMNSSLGEPGAVACICGGMGAAERQAAKNADKIIIWQDSKLAGELGAIEELQGRVWLASPVNLFNAPINVEYIQYNPDSIAVLPAKADPLSTGSETRTLLLARIAAIYDAARAYLYQKKHLKTVKVLVLLSGDESLEEQKKLIKLAAQENPGKKIVIKTLSDPAFRKEFEKTGKLFPYNEIFEFERAYSVKSCQVLYLSIFCAEVVFGELKFAKKAFLDGSLPVPLRQKLTDFYFSVCKNSFLSNAESLLADIMDPFSRKMMEERDKSNRTRLNLEKISWLGNHGGLPGAILKKWYVGRICHKIIKKLPTGKGRGDFFNNMRACFVGGEKAARPADPRNASMNRLMADKRTPEVWQKKMRRCISRNEKDLAGLIGLDMLAKKTINPGLLRDIITLCFSSGDFDAALAAGRLGENLYSEWNNGEFEFDTLRFLLLTGQNEDALAQLAKFALCRNHGNLNLSRFRIDHKLKKLYGDFDWEKIFSLLKLARCPQNSLQRARLLCNIKCHKDAAAILEKTNEAKAAELLFQYYIDSNQFGDARRILEKRLSRQKTYAEKAVIYYTAINDIEKIRELLADKKILAENKNYASLYLAHTLVGELWQGHKYFAKCSHFHLLDKYFPHSLISSLYSDMDHAGRAVVFSECFIGDELRFSRMYPAIAKMMNASQCVFTCDKRLENIFRRTFPGLSFHAFEKTREIDLADDQGKYVGLPGMECARYMDASTWQKFRGYDRVITVAGALASVLRSYEQLENLPSLQCDPGLRDEFRKRLLAARDKSGKRYVAGLAWRSNLSDVRRDTFFLTKKLLDALLALPDILWVSCQYDGLKPEENEFFSRHGNFMVLPEVDLFNDVESAAALYSALDIMISSPVYSADLAAAMGTPTLVPMPTPGYASYCRPGTSIALFDSSYEYIHYKHAEGIERAISRLYEKLRELPNDHGVSQ